MIGMHRVLPPEVRLYSGDDGLLLPGLAVGATGAVSVASHVAAPAMTAMVAAFQGGRIDEARRWHEALWPLCLALFSEPSPIPLKWLMNRLGHEVGGVRAPLIMLDDNRFGGLWNAYESLVQSDLWWAPSA